MAEFGASEGENDKIGEKLAPFNPTSDEACRIALVDLLQIKEGDILYDLGCGDARLLVYACKLFNTTTSKGEEGAVLDNIAVEKEEVSGNKVDTAIVATTITSTPAAAYPIRCVGVEYDLVYVNKARKLLSDNLIGEEQVSILHDNVLNIDFSEANAIFVYLVPDGMRALRQQLIMALERDVRIVTYVFSIPDLTPTDVKIYKGITKIYLYTAESLSPSVPSSQAFQTPSEPISAANRGSKLKDAIRAMKEKRAGKES